MFLSGLASSHAGSDRNRTDSQMARSSRNHRRERQNREDPRQEPFLRDSLRDGVAAAIRGLGSGFLDASRNPALRERLRTGQLSTSDFYRQLVCLASRILVVLVAEETTETGDNLFHPPCTPHAVRESYSRFHSLSRLRALAADSPATRPSDLFESLQRLFVMLRKGDPALGVPGLGSFLFSERSTPDLDAATLPDDILLDAFRRLCFSDVTSNQGDSVRRPFDFGRITGEDLGFVYESLLALHPQIDAQASAFTLAAAGRERKTTGSYYTPPPLVDCLLDATLDPVMEEAIRGRGTTAIGVRTDDEEAREWAISHGEAERKLGKNDGTATAPIPVPQSRVPDVPSSRTPEQRLLALKVCDPACGSGNLLVAAARRMAERLARLRAGGAPPTPLDVLRAKRDVISRCLYGVDVNPMAVEWCRISLWLEASEPGTPLSSFDHHIRCGNSLLGATPQLVANGIPNEAYQPVEEVGRALLPVTPRGKSTGRSARPPRFSTSDNAPAGRDDKEACRRLKRENTRQRRDAATRHPSTPRRSLESPRALADAWCAAFVWTKDDSSIGRLCPTEFTLRRLEAGDDIGSPDLDETRRVVERLRAQYGFFHWRLEFSEVFPEAAAGGELHDSCHARGGFDVVLGNPPFVNAIEGGVEARTRSLIRARHRILGGTADLGYLFLSESIRLVHENGRVGLIQPRAVLNANPAAELREWLSTHRPPNLIYAPDRSDFFPGADVFVCALVLGPDKTCRVSRDPDPATARWSTGIVAGRNWWREMVRLVEGTAAATVPPLAVVGDVFDVSASMTAGDAYDVRPFLVDRREGPGLKLATTGLIEPGACLWGDAVCRHLKVALQFPRIDDSAPLTRSLRRRVDRATRPKILVAGLSRRVECFLDAGGEFAGAVSTFSIYHPNDDVGALRVLCDHLLTDSVTSRFRAELGGNALGGGNTTMRRDFLQALPLPDKMHATGL